MYRFNRFALFTAASVRNYRKRSRWLPPPAATTGSGNFVKAGKISGEDLPEKKSGNNRRYSTFNRKVLPPEISGSVVKLTCKSAAKGGACDVYLVGTVHISSKSSREVQAVIDFLKPQVVFLELCSRRSVYLNGNLHLKVPTITEMVEMSYKTGNAFGVLCSWCLAEVASKLNVQLGAEFRVAYEEAKKCGAKIVLGDRPVQITMQRIQAELSPWNMIKSLCSCLFQGDERLSEKLSSLADVESNVDHETVDLITAELKKHFPSLAQTLVDERDQYMSAMLFKIAREHSSIVAVVGKGHLQGIQKYWGRPVAVDQPINYFV